MTAFNEALMALRSGHCEAAIVGGSNVTLDPVAFIKFDRLGLLSPDGKCAAFDIDGKGYVRSETVGAFFLQRASEARRVYAKVVNVKVNADGFKVEGITFPSGRLQAQLLREVYAEVNLDPTKVSYVEAHGTGTKAGDPQELGAINSVFCGPGRKEPLKIGSVKTNVGHAEAASGIAAVAKVILAMETASIAPNLHLNELNPNIPSLHDGSLEIVTKVTPFAGGLIGINSFGFGGANVHAILEANPGPSVDSLPPEKPELPRLVLMAGRTKDSLTKTLNRLEAEGPYPDPTYALLNRVGQRSTKQFPYRGYALIPVDEGSGKEVLKVVEQAPTEKRPLWFAFTGMGCQWTGMARQMMQFDVFARSIRKSHEVLERYGVDLIDLVTNEKARKRTVVSPLVSISAVQVALVDMLRAMGIQPDGIVGHSIGETGSAYADGGFTGEQAVLCSYWQGRCTELEDPPKGAMAAVGLTWEETAKRCPLDVYPACHNAEDSVTVSGPAESVAKMMAELKAENVFAREVDSLDVAFHSKHVHSIGPALRKAIEKVVPEPKPRSKRWVSSSLPESRWQEPVAQLCSAEYHVNNFLSPVLFHGALQHVPQNAIVVEIGPHCLLQAILKRALGPGVSCLGLMKRNADNLEFFLGSLGNLHTLGIKLDLSPLYPPIPWPVPRGTPNIGHLVSWDHSETWHVAGWKDFSIVIQKTFVVDMENNGEDKYLAGHLVDGRLVFPATGYMVLAWKCLASRFGKPLSQIPVVFEDVSIWRATILPKTGSVLFEVNMMPVSGEFEVCEDRAVVARGRIRVAEKGEKLLDKDPPGAPEEAVAYDLNSEGIYKELKLRGYEHCGAFRGILKADLQNPYAKLKWDDNWVTFLASMLQLFTLGHPLRSFLQLVRIQSCRIDPEAHIQALGKVKEEGLDAVYSWHLNTCRAGGVELKGLSVSTAQRRPVQRTPVVEEYRFVPYEDDQEAIRERECNVREYADVCCGVARRILESYGEERGGFYGVINGYREIPEQVLNRYVENRAENDGLLQALVAILNNASSSTSLASTAHSVALACKEQLEEDILNTALFEENPLRHLIDIVVENKGPDNIRVLELAAGGNALLMARWVHRYLTLHGVELKTEYTVAHPSPNSLAREQVPEGVETIRWQPSSISDTKMASTDLVVVARGVTTAAIDGPNTLGQELSSLCKERGFLLLSLRTSLTGAEEFLSTVSGVSLRVHAVEATAAALKAHGFRLVGRKSNNLSSLLLFRKTTTPVHMTRQELVRVKNEGFHWVETLKKKVVEYDGKPTGHHIWLFSGDVGSSGIVGLTNCLRKETGGSHIR
ncbi:hypothetical protein V5799_011044 [Amblyomma americanum]|uniref:Fatty acid synthase n=1 Tax=Amblyomma americanum TaxID=6943 RepID=A0AAQ4EIH3_AMBAM